MKKLVKRAVYCKHCNHQQIPARYSWFCDNCKKQICDETQNPSDLGSLQITVFFKSGGLEASHLDFCGYKCLRHWLINYNPAKKEVDFIVLPYIHSNKSETWLQVRDRFLKEFMNDNPSRR